MYLCVFSGERVPAGRGWPSWRNRARRNRLRPLSGISFFLPDIVLPSGSPPDVASAARITNRRSSKNTERQLSFLLTPSSSSEGARECVHKILCECVYLFRDLYLFFVIEHACSAFAAFSRQSLSLSPFHRIGFGVAVSGGTGFWFRFFIIFFFFCLLLRFCSSAQFRRYHSRLFETVGLVLNTGGSVASMTFSSSIPLSQMAGAGPSRARNGSLRRTTNKQTKKKPKRKQKATTERYLGSAEILAAAGRGS